VIEYTSDQAYKSSNIQVIKHTSDQQTNMRASMQSIERLVGGKYKMYIFFGGGEYELSTGVKI
jgi:hypothetical protein